MHNLEDGNYARDSRVSGGDRARRLGHYLSVIPGKMLANIGGWQDEDGVEVHEEIRIKYEVCETCRGKGSHVNPSIDASGLGEDDFDEDPDFREDYMSGFYDAPCYECNGARVVPEPDPWTDAEKALVKRFEELMADAALMDHYGRMGY